MEEGVQHDPATQLARIPATSSGDNHASASVGRKSEIISGNAIGGRSVRLRHEVRTREYMKRRTKEGMTKKEIIRCLKRYVAREVFTILRQLGREQLAQAA